MLDNTKTYALALEGGGARGAYQVGVWKALAEKGIRFGAVSGTSVGALNGALFAMGDLELAMDIWQNITFSKVMNVDEGLLERISERRIEKTDLAEVQRMLRSTVRNHGIDVQPLRQWIREVVDAEKIAQSDTELFITTFSLSDRRELVLRAKDLAPQELYDMLLASAYLPVFHKEPLGGKRYIDGGVADVLPLDALLDAGWRDIIAIRLHGFGVEKRIEIPSDANIVYIEPSEHLGSILNFDAESSRRNIIRGYIDGLHTIQS